MSAKLIAEALRDALISPNVENNTGKAANLVDTTERIATALELLGAGATSMRAIEEHRRYVLEASENISSALHDLADALREKRL